MTEGYFILEDGDQKGPFTLEELTGKEIDIHSRILSPLAGTWQDACDLPELYPYFEALGIYFPTGDNLASFGWRLLAYVVDYIILSLVTEFILRVLMLFGMKFVTLSYTNPLNIPVSQLVILVKIEIVFFVTLIVYNAICEASPMKGSVGKKVFKMVVVDVDGVSQNFLNALLRSIGKAFSIFFIYMGFLSIFFTEHRQALHDLLAKTYVVKRD